MSEYVFILPSHLTGSLAWCWILDWNLSFRFFFLPFFLKKFFFLAVLDLWCKVWAFSSCSRGACGILVPQPGLKPSSPELEDGFLPTGPPKKSPFGISEALVPFSSMLHSVLIHFKRSVSFLWELSRSSLCLQCPEISFWCGSTFNHYAEQWVGPSNQKKKQKTKTKACPQFWEVFCNYLIFPSLFFFEVGELLLFRYYTFWVVLWFSELFQLF